MTVKEEDQINTRVHDTILKDTRKITSINIIDLVVDISMVVC